MYQKYVLRCVRATKRSFMAASSVHLPERPDNYAALRMAQFTQHAGAGSAHAHWFPCIEASESIVPVVSQTTKAALRHAYWIQGPSLSTLRLRTPYPLRPRTPGHAPHDEFSIHSRWPHSVCLGQKLPDDAWMNAPARPSTELLSHDKRGQTPPRG